MIRHTFIDKSNTIFKGYKQNFGLNPVAELNYGKMVSRALIHFDESELCKLYEDKDLGDLSGVKHILKMTNCASQDGLPYEKQLNDGFWGVKERASSFDVIVFTVPKNWDAGRGFEFTNDFWIRNRKSASMQGCNWYDCATRNPWDTPGIYTCDELQKEIEKIKNGEESKIIIAHQHFDFGNEQFAFDITDWVNKVIKGEVINHGLCIAFTPRYELSGETTVVEHKFERPIVSVSPCKDNVKVEGTTNVIKKVKSADCNEQLYVGFFTNNTNTFFHPYVETIYEDKIQDDRAQFYIGKTNRLYFYSIVDGEFTNLDDIPVCDIDGIKYEVKQAGKGVYYALIEPSKMQMEANTIYYDKWSKIALNGQEMGDVELEFVALPSGRYFQFGAGTPMKDILVPQVSGVDDLEILPYGEVRRVIVDCRKKFTTDKKDFIDGADYRIWVSDGNREIDVIDYTPVEKSFMNNFFYLHTDDFVPGEYHVDFRIKANGETRQYKDRLKFIIRDDVTEFYR